MLFLLRAVLVVLAGLAALDAVLISASPFITDSVPVSRQPLTVSLAVSAMLLGLGWLALGLQRRIGQVAHAGSLQLGTAGLTFERAFGSLVRHLLVASVASLLVLVMLTIAILDRVNQNFAVFGWSVEPNISTGEAHCIPDAFICSARSA